MRFSHNLQVLYQNLNMVCKTLYGRYPTFKPFHKSSHFLAAETDDTITSKSYEMRIEDDNPYPEKVVMGSVISQVL